MRKVFLLNLSPHEIPAVFSVFPMSIHTFERVKPWLLGIPKQVLKVVVVFHVEQLMCWKLLQ